MQNQAVRQSPMNGWQNEFVQQQQHQPQHIQQAQFRQQNSMPNYQSSFIPNYQGMSGMAGSASVGQGSVQSASNLSQAPAAFDESAFEAAFDQAQADVHQQGLTSSEQHQIPDEDVRSTELETTLERESSEQIRIGSDLIGKESESDVQEQQGDPDELARTAGHLLDSLSHDTSQKFKESSFLALMRRIRDREVHIEGDEFREVSSLP